MVEPSRLANTARTLQPSARSAQGPTDEMQRAGSVMATIVATAQLSGMSLGCVSIPSDALTEPESSPMLLDRVKPSFASPAPAPVQREAVAARDDRLEASGDSSKLVSSTTTGDDGSRYVAGVFAGTLVVGGVLLTSHGGDDIFVARLWPSGSVDWAEAIGSKRDERDPKVSFSDGRVKLVGMTSGAVDCGRGPLNTWSTETFFLCTFDTDGTPKSGATFPTGRQ